MGRQWSSRSLGFSRGNAETQRIELKEKVENAFKTPTKGSASPTSRLIISQKAEKVKHDGVSQIVDENGEPNVGTYGTENPDIRWSLSQADLPGLENAGWDLFEAVAKEKPEAKPVIDEIKKELTKRVAFDSFRRKPGEHKTLSDIRNTLGLLSLKIGQRAGKKWVSEDEVYDALLDLAEVADIPPAAIGLGGRIQLEAAGRATTRTGGTYAPRKKNIMLYHRGALAHEWMHALDNYFGGNRIYTVELQEIKMPSERGSESIKVNHDVATPTSDGKIKVAEEAAKVNGIRYLMRGIRVYYRWHQSD